jgi:hypothetical protein
MHDKGSHSKIILNPFSGNPDSSPDRGMRGQLTGLKSSIEIIVAPALGIDCGTSSVVLVQCELIHKSAVRTKLASFEHEIRGIAQWKP